MRFLVSPLGVLGDASGLEEIGGDSNGEDPVQWEFLYPNGEGVVISDGVVATTLGERKPFFVSKPSELLLKKL